jgi:hypothetical protein
MASRSAIARSRSDSGRLCVRACAVLGKRALACAFGTRVYVSVFHVSGQQEANHHARRIRSCKHESGPQNMTIQVLLPYLARHISASEAARGRELIPRVVLALCTADQDATKSIQETDGVHRGIGACAHVS